MFLIGPLWAASSLPRALRLAPTALIVCLLAHAVHAQSATATITGIITDEKQAVIAKGSITAVNEATRLARRTTSGEGGYFTIPLLPPGNYTLTVEHDGFAPARISGVMLNVGDQRAIQIQLKVGGVGETVEIKGDAGVQESPAVGTVVDRQFVANLPLNGRSFQSLIALAPGVVQTKASAAAPGQFSVNGQRADANYFTVDGVGANIGHSTFLGMIGNSGGNIPGLTAVGGTNNLVSIDALQEFKIETSTYAPEFGRTPGGQISLVTRSGTNEYHGTLFEYFRNDALDANDWFANSLGQGRSALRQNNFGGVLGGPLRLPKEAFGPFAYDGRNRTFFFFSYEGQRRRPRSNRS
jgi:hypothetical protein